MPPRISLALAIHNHQPVGNFGWVIRDVYEQAYEPMIGALERHRGVRVALHYTGALLDWIRTEEPAFLDRLRALVERGQVELLGGGLYEPVLASLPERDRIAQLERMAAAVEGLGGRRPQGAWLAERVWEPSLPTSLAAAGYRWTILDDAHFRAAAIPESELWGAYTTEDEGRLLTVFGTEQGLRYRIPFGEVDDVIGYLRANATEAGDRVGMMGDDGEKFGSWPTTYEHCWGSGQWVDRFFRALDDNRDWLSTVTPSDWLEREPPIGRVYVPTSSYAEMGGWALPPDEAVVFSEVLHGAIDRRRPEARWLRGGFWRNFQVRYREINDLHKQMLRTSDKVAAMEPGAARDRALDHLHRGQSNDCYWHGLFGGIYISHMRLATLAELIAAEDLADAAGRKRRVGDLRDVDLDGVADAFLAGPGQVVTVDLAEGAGIGSWDIRAPRHALTAVLRRRPEAYHATLRRHESRAVPDPATLGTERHDGPDDARGGESGVTSIHEIVQVKEPGLADRLHYDPYERRSGLVRFLALDADPHAWSTAAAPELGDARDGAWDAVEIRPGRLVTVCDATVESRETRLAVRLERTLILGGTRRRPTLELVLDVRNRSSASLRCRLGVEWAITMLGGGANPAAWWDVGGRRTSHDAAGEASGATRLAQGNDHVGVAVSTTVEPPAEAWWAPIDTISNSEGGFERVYQGSALLLSWPLDLEPDGRTTIRVRHVVTTSRDLAAEEAAEAATPA